MRRLLPPFLMLILLGTLFLLHRLHPPTPAFGPLATLVGVPLLVLGLTALVAARIQFRRSASEIMTFAKPRNLVTTGLFRFSRNPMYLSMLAILTGAASLVDLWCALAAPLVFFAAANWWYIPFEETAAAATFGDKYQDYRQAVRRWI